MKLLDINDKIKKGIIESTLTVFFTVLYMVYGIHYLPLLMIFIPLPFVVLGVRNHISYNIISIVLASLIIQMLLGSTSGASLILNFAPLSLAINYLVNKRKGNFETILISTGVFFLSFLILISLGSKVSDFNLTNQIQEVLSQALKWQIEIFQEMGMTNSQINNLRDSLESEYKIFLVHIPSFLIIISFLITYINIFFSTAILRKMGYGFLPEQRFSRFKLPNNIIFGIGIMFLSAYIIRGLGIGYSEALLLNLSFLAGFVFIVQGLAVIDSFLLKIRMKLGFRILILILTIIFIPISGIIFFLGLFDSIFDLRKLRGQKS